ncbi:actin protein 2/3 complex subunit-like protein [Wolffia australiana]
MEDFDAPLDFESEAPLSRQSPAANDGKRKKIIGLDDLLSHYYNPVDETSKKSKRKQFHSDDEEKNVKKKEELLSKFVFECQNQVNDIVAEDDIPLWGLQAFGKQKSLPPFDSADLTNSILLKSFIKCQTSSLLKLEMDQGEIFLDGLLVDKWLLNLVYLSGSVEDCLASWTFHKALYSSKKNVQEAGCDFWCSILSAEAEVYSYNVDIKWFPCFSAFKDALEVYGFIPYCIALPTLVSNDSFEIFGPPINIICWLKLLAVFCRIRNGHRLFSMSEVEEFFDIIVWLFLDHQLQGISFLLNECMLSLITFFTDKEWPDSSVKIVNSIASRIPMDLNCLRAVECISGVDKRSRTLRSQLSAQILSHSVGRPGARTMDLLKLILKDDVKDKDCDFLKIYIHLVLAENWLASDPSMNEDRAVSEAWLKYLRILSTQISNTDWRSYAAKVRNRAFYLKQTMRT